MRDINKQDMSGKTALMHAAWEGDLRRVRLLLAQGANINLEDDYEDTVLSFAVRSCNCAVLQEIINTKINLERRDKNGYHRTAIFWPAEMGIIDVLEVLLDAGANPNAKDSDGRTPLKWAVQGAHLKCTDLLIRYKADVNTKTKDGETPLMSAAINGDVKTVKRLLEAGAKANVVSKNGFSALMYAAYYNRIEVAKVLVAAGASKTAINKLGKRSVDIANDKGFVKIVDILQSEPE